MGSSEEEEEEVSNTRLFHFGSFMSHIHDMVMRFTLSAGDGISL